MYKRQAKNKEKTKIIIELRQKYKEIPLKYWLKISKLARSSYYEWEKKLKEVNQKEIKDIETVRKIVEESKRRYGYRRV